MSLPKLTVVPAGAGSGKTHTIQQRLGKWVAEGSVRADRIAAVTFTEAAASELRQRIRKGLLEKGRNEDALLLDRAYISTIHGFGLRVLGEFAFEAGSSPRPRLLNDDEEELLIRIALARSAGAAELAGDLARFGYRMGYDETAEDAYRKDAKKCVDLLRMLKRERHADGHYAKVVQEWIRDRYGETCDGEEARRKLHGAALALLKGHPSSHERLFARNKFATDKLRKDFRNLARVRGDAAVLENDWRLWEELRDLRTSKRGAEMPPGYDGLAKDVMDAANALTNHPGPLDTACGHAAALLAAAEQALKHYADDKRSTGIVDFTDMIADAGRLLERDEVAQALKERIDCLVVDEFQDTNPLQFSLLWRLHEQGVPTLVVGDLKQAIMGFQGADPRLFAALQEKHPEQTQPLKDNWRSRPGVMGFVNALGKGLFGKAYGELAPQRSKAPLAPLEAVLFAGNSLYNKHLDRAKAVGERLKALLEDGSCETEDRRTEQLRRLRGGDMAVLCHTHNQCEQYAQMLRSQGLRVRLREKGWLESRAVQIAWHALEYIADPTSRHAALYLAATELGSCSLEDALRQLMDGGKVADPVLDKLDALAPGVADRTVYALVADTFGHLGLYDIAAEWTDGQQQRANLLRLLAEASEFMDANREAMARGGYHGLGIQSFLGWLGAKVDRDPDGDADRQPDPRVVDEEAIEITTWHSAKGREWPVVAVCALDSKVDARLPALEIAYGDFGDLGELAENAHIMRRPKFDAREQKENFLKDLNKRDAEEKRRLLYVAFTRAREKLILEWPQYQKGKETTTLWSILTESTGLALEGDKWKVGEEEFPCLVTRGPDVPGSDAPDAAPEGAQEAPGYARRAIVRGTAPETTTPDAVSPSRHDDRDRPDLGKLTAERYADRIRLGEGKTGAAIGSLLHLCFEVPGTHPGAAETIGKRAKGRLEPAEIAEVAAAVRKFEGWLAERLSPISIQREQPLLALDGRGSVVSGVADLIVETREGVWIIDHKSDLAEDAKSGFAAHLPQLQTYAHALGGESKLAGVAINWIRLGEVALLPL